MKVQHVFRIQLNIQPDEVVLSAPKKEVQRYGKTRDHQHLSV
jgi:hypothetical protein